MSVVKIAGLYLVIAAGLTLGASAVTQELAAYAVAAMAVLIGG